MAPKSLEDVQQIFYTLSATEVLLAAATAASILWPILKIAWEEDPRLKDIEPGIDKTFVWAFQGGPPPNLHEIKELIRDLDWMINMGAGLSERVHMVNTILLFDGTMSWLKTVQEGLYGDRDLFTRRALTTVGALFWYAKDVGSFDMVEQWWKRVLEVQSVSFVNTDLTVGQPPPAAPYMPRAQELTTKGTSRPEEDEVENFFTAFEDLIKERRTRR